MLPTAYVAVGAALLEGFDDEPQIDRLAEQWGSNSGSAGRCGMVVGSVRTAVPLELTQVLSGIPQTGAIL